MTAKKETEEKQKKKVVRRRKTKKEKESPVVKAIRLVVETGEISIGYSSGIKGISTKKPKLIILPTKAPPKIIDEIKKNLKIPILNFEGSTMELGSVCGKPYPISVLCVYSEGTSNILKLVE